MQIDDLLITESQLKTRLNKSVHENRRGEFSLLLAMLSHDALDFSQFHLPKSETHSAYVDEEQLRERFGAGPKQLLAPEKYDHRARARVGDCSPRRANRHESNKIKPLLKS